MTIDLSLGVIEVCWNRHHCVLQFLSEICLGRFLHLGQNHSRNLFRRESLLFVGLTDLHFDVWFSFLVHNLEWNKFHISLDLFITKLSPNQSLCVKNSSRWVDCSLVLGSISDQTFRVGECHIAGSNSVSLVVGDDIDLNQAINIDVQ